MPTERGKLLELAEWCEAAEGPDRELDAQIWLACVPGSTRSELRYWHAAIGKECVIDETRQADGRLIVVPAYSASIDAAMTLVPEGWFCMVANGYDKKGKPCLVKSTAFICPLDNIAGAEPVNATTPALALTAACLRARATENTDAPFA